MSEGVRRVPVPAAAVNPAADPAPAPPFRAWRPIALALVLAAATIALYAPTRHFDFVELDDPLYVRENPHVMRGLSLEGVAWAFTSTHAGFWIPAVWVSYMADISVFGPGPGGHHVTNVLLHASTAVLLFLWFTRTTGALGRSWAVAALFALHPLRVESVAWITERKDVLSGLFWMLGLWAYLAYVQRQTWRRYSLVAAAFGAALMAKPMVVMFPLALLLIDVWPLNRLAASPGLPVRGTGAKAARRDRPGRGGGLPNTWHRASALIKEKLPLLGIAVAGAIVTLAAHSRVNALSSLEALPPAQRIWIALVAYADYVRLTIWPSGLAAFYSLPGVVPPWRASTAILVVIGMTVWISRSARQRPYLAVGWAWYLATLLPVTGLVQAGVQARADRFTYLPSIGLAVMVVWGVAELLPAYRWRRAALTAATIAAVVAYGTAARSQLWHWKDSVALWTRATMIQLDLDEYSAHLQCGKVLGDQRRFSEARAHFALAAGLRPEASDPHVGLGLAWSAAGQTDSAIAEYREALRRSPDLPIVHNDLGVLLEGRGHLAESLRHFQEAVRLAPSFSTARVNLGLALVKTDRVAESVGQFREALRLDPGNAIAQRAISTLTPGAEPK